MLFKLCHINPQITNVSCSLTGREITRQLERMRKREGEEEQEREEETLPAVDALP